VMRETTAYSANDELYFDFRGAVARNAGFFEARREERETHRHRRPVRRDQIVTSRKTIQELATTGGDLVPDDWSPSR